MRSGINQLVLPLLAVAVVALALISSVLPHYGGGTQSCNTIPQPTHEIFCCPGPVGYSISAGYVMPGEEIGVSIYAWKSVDFDGYFTVSVYEVYSDCSMTLVFRREYAAALPIKAYWKTPEKAPATYEIVVEAVDNERGVVDVIRSRVTVPPQEARARLVTDKGTYSKGEGVILKVFNLGPTSIMFGRPYAVYYWNGSSWIPADWVTPDVWTMEAYILQPGQEFTQEIDLTNAIPGKYMVVKSVWAEGTGIRLNLTAEFIVTES